MSELVKNKFEFLYCFDNKYNIQALTSIISLLDNIDCKIKINIIHPDNNFLDHIPKIINTHKNLSELKIYNFQKIDYDFPNLKNSHVSEATYYRLFIDKYINNDIDFLIYLDADVICNTNPIESIENNIFELIKSKDIISVKTEWILDNNRAVDSANEVFERLNLRSRYFNAGVMIINYQKWLNQNLSEKLFKKLQELGSKVKFWDQDVLNSYFDNHYLELDKKLNYYASNLENKTTEEFCFLHYVGSNKPWLTSGAFTKTSQIYHNNYSKLFNDSFHITHIWKLGSLKELTVAIFNLSFFKIEKKFLYIKIFLKSLK